MAAETPKELEAPEASPPSEWLLLRVWLLLGMQSFGGGVATLALIRQAVVERHGWVREEEFVRCMALSHLAPGINLFALAILLGRRIAGWRGVWACLLGLILPSASIAILMTAGYAVLREIEAVQAAMQGVLPATLGMGLLVSVQIARPLLSAALKEGKSSFGVSLGLLAMSGALIAWSSLPVLFILFAAGGVSAVYYTLRKRRGADIGSAE